MAKRKAESDILRECLELLRERGIRVWRNNVGKARPLNTSGQVVSFGIKGSSDIIGLLPDSGRFLAVETKTDEGKLSEDQRNFLLAVNAEGGLGITVRDVADLKYAIDCAFGTQRGTKVGE